MASLRVLLAGVQPIFARRELADHGVSAGSVSTKQSILWAKVPLSLHRFEAGDRSPQDETQRSSGITGTAAHGFQAAAPALSLAVKPSTVRALSAFHWDRRQPQQALCPETPALL
jgi:hypothetical protein